MSASEELTDLFRQWRLLTEQEGRAIAAGAWLQVDGFQSAKARLQPRISELSQRIEPQVHEARFRPLIEELMEMERRNSALVRREQATVEEQQQSLDRTQRNLRHIQKSYLPPARTHWQSYS